MSRIKGEGWESDLPWTIARVRIEHVAHWDDLNWEQRSYLIAVHRAQQTIQAWETHITNLAYGKHGQ